jgi:hypothetical protein
VTKRHITLDFLPLIGFLLLASCSVANKVVDLTVIDTQISLEEGKRVSYRLEPGRYRIEMTADKDGASITWVGTDCATTGERTSYSGLCEFPVIGQVVIENPTFLGLGAGTSVTIKITKLRQ